MYEKKFAFSLVVFVHMRLFCFDFYCFLDFLIIFQMVFPIHSYSILGLEFYVFTSDLPHFLFQLNGFQIFSLIELHCSEYGQSQKSKNKRNEISI